MSPTPDVFSGASSGLGYLFQARWALHRALQRLDAAPSDHVVLEGLDDIEFSDEGGTPIELVQTKHRVRAVADLQDSSTALWGTLRVWATRQAGGAIDLNRVTLVLVTNGQVPSDSAAFCLTGSEARNVDRALDVLTAVAETSEAVANQAAYQAFLGLPTETRRLLLDRVSLVPASPNVIEVRGAIEASLRFAVRREHLGPLVDRLEGWWFRKVVESLSESSAQPLALLEIEEQVHELAQQFRRANLPIDFADLSLDALSPSDHRRAFVEQLRLINLGSDRILDAVLDYYKAFHQRSRWLKDGLLAPGELGRYERRLVSEWRRYFNMLVEDLNDGDVEEERVRIGRQIYRWAEIDTRQPIRPECLEPYVWRGTYQMMSDQGDVGWHPNFRARLASLFAEAAS